MNWEERRIKLIENEFVCVGDKWIHKPSKKEFWVSDIKKLDDWEFDKLITSRCIYQLP
jgi:hypothetical protein